MVPSKPLTIAECVQAIKEVQHRIWGMVGETFNLSSNGAVSRALFQGKPHIKARGRSRSGRGYSTSGPTIERILAESADDYSREILALFVIYRDLRETEKKLNEFQCEVHSLSGRVHANFRFTVSGRYIASHPNILSLSSASGIKECIVAPKGYFFVAGDFSTIDLRGLANECFDHPEARMGKAICYLPRYPVRKPSDFLTLR